jgi:hypothetical protein
MFTLKRTTWSGDAPLRQRDSYYVRTQHHISEHDLTLIDEMTLFLHLLLLSAEVLLENPLNAALMAWCSPHPGSRLRSLTRCRLVKQFCFKQLLKIVLVGPLSVKEIQHVAAVRVSE